MRDIVERLRDADYNNAPSRCMEAAREIEQLRKALQSATDRGEPVAWRASSDHKFSNGMLTDDPFVVAAWREHKSITVEPLYASSAHAVSSHTSLTTLQERGGED